MTIFLNSVTTYLVGILQGPLPYSIGDEWDQPVLDLEVCSKKIKDKKFSYDQLLTYEEMVIHIQSFSKGIPFQSRMEYLKFLAL